MFKLECTTVVSAIPIGVSVVQTGPMPKLQALNIGCTSMYCNSGTIQLAARPAVAPAPGGGSMHEAVKTPT